MLSQLRLLTALAHCIFFYRFDTPTVRVLHGSKVALGVVNVLTDTVYTYTRLHLALPVGPCSVGPNALHTRWGNASTLRLLAVCQRFLLVSAAL